jgi:hypothetical protein
MTIGSKWHVDWDHGNRLIRGKVIGERPRQPCPMTEPFVSAGPPEGPPNESAARLIDDRRVISRNSCRCRAAANVSRASFPTLFITITITIRRRQSDMPTITLSATLKGNGYQATVTFSDGVSMSSAETYPTIAEAMTAAALRLLDMPERLEALDHIQTPTTP